MMFTDETWDSSILKDNKKYSIPIVIIDKIDWENAKMSGTKLIITLN